MRNKKLLAAVVAAIIMLVGGLGMALWPSSAGATGPIRKFSGPLSPRASTFLAVRVHNPHPTATLKPSVVVRGYDGAVTANVELIVGPNAFWATSAHCPGQCTVEVNMPNALLQPSIEYTNNVGHTEYVYAGDFSR